MVVYPLYDGYWSRSLPTDEFELIGSHATQSGQNEYVFIRCVNNSTWTVSKVKGRMVFQYPDGSSEVIIDFLETRGGEDILIRPGYNPWLRMKTSPKLSKVLQNGYFQSFEWTLLEVYGTPKPMRIVKAPVDWIEGLFERVPN
jgi:hypothetical protein